MTLTGQGATGYTAFETLNVNGQAGGGDTMTTTNTNPSTATNVTDDGVLTVFPGIVTLAPPVVLASLGGIVIINGTNFTAATGVTFGGVAVAFNVLSDTQIRATLVARTAATVDVQVTSSTGTVDFASAGDNFVFAASAADLEEALADEGTFDPATGINTVDPTTGRATINLATESTTENGMTVVNVTDGAGTTVGIDVADLPGNTTDITVSMQPATAGDVTAALAEAGLPAGTMAFGVEISISDQFGGNIGGTTAVTVQFELPAGFDPATSAVVVNGEVITVTVVSLGPPVVVQASLPHLTTVLLVEIVEEEAEEEPVDEVVEEPPAAEVLTLRAGGQFVLWTFGPALAADLFGVVKIAWLFDSTTVSWTSFIPPLGIINFALNDGAVLWIVSETAQAIPIAA